MSMSEQEVAELKRALDAQRSGQVGAVSPPPKEPSLLGKAKNFAKRLNQ